MCGLSAGFGPRGALCALDKPGARRSGIGSDLNLSGADSGKLLGACKGGYGSFGRWERHRGLIRSRWRSLFYCLFVSHRLDDGPGKELYRVSSGHPAPGVCTIARTYATNVILWLNPGSAPKKAARINQVEARGPRGATASLRSRRCRARAGLSSFFSRCLCADNTEPSQEPISGRVSDVAASRLEIPQVTPVTDAGELAEGAPEP